MNISHIENILKLKEVADRYAAKKQKGLSASVKTTSELILEVEDSSCDGVNGYKAGGIAQVAYPKEIIELSIGGEYGDNITLKPSELKFFIKVLELAEKQL